MSEILLPASELHSEIFTQTSEPETAPGNQPQAATKSRLYAAIWRWHFYAGLLTTPILWLVILTGALYVFRTELTAYRDRALQMVTPQSDRLSYNELREIAAQAADSQEIEALIVTPDAGRSIRFVAHVEPAEGDAHDELHQHIYLNPYTGDVLGKRIQEHDFFAIVLELHRSLMLGSTGRVLSELVTSWGLLLLASGVYLWWPRGKSNVGVWVPRVRGKWYAVLRDWHAVTGFYVVPLAALVMTTGLFFTLVSGTAFNTTAKKLGHWPAKWFVASKSPPPQANSQPAPLDDVVATFLANSRPGDSVAIRLAASPDISHKAFLMRDEDKNSLRTIDVDQYTAEKLSQLDPPDLPLLYRVRLWAVSIHMGQIFSTPTKVLALITSLALFLLSVSGVWMWWERRPRGRTGFPRQPAPKSVPKWIWAVVGVCALLLPVAGLSMLLIGLLEWTVGRLRRSSA